MTGHSFTVLQFISEYFMSNYWTIANGSTNRPAVMRAKQCKQIKQDKHLYWYE